VRRFLYWQVRLALRPFLAPWVPLRVQRAWAALAGLTTRGPRGVTRDAVDLNGVRALRLVPAGATPDAAVLYLHGGAYVIGGPDSHAKLAAHIAHASRCVTYFVDYRLAPEHPFPAALEDALAAYRWLLTQGPAPRRIVLAGDSAGGGLALAAAMSIRDQKLPAPAALVLISPWTDLTLSGASHASKAAADPMLRASWLKDSATRYAGMRALTDPLLSPALGDLAGLPPMLIQVGSEEILLSDAERLAHGTTQAGGRAQLRRYEGLWHDFQAHAGMLPEADEALAEIGAFVGAAHA
jgi:monoterpene epsilon-lactone hydrolase